MPDTRRGAARVVGRRPTLTGRTRSSMTPQWWSVRRTRAPGLVVASSQVRGSHLVDVDGQLNLATVGLLDAAMARIYPTRRWRRAANDLVLDLTDVTFLDVIGVGALRRAHDLARARGKLRIGTPAHPGTRRLLLAAVEHGWLDQVFRPYDPSF